ncbi:MAG: inorganic pyrophosphatase [Chloroflexota bacterium]
MKPDFTFWQEMASLAASTPIIIDRPKDRPHPNWPKLIYPLDYGYLEGTSASDGGGIDVWIGSLGTRALTGILCTFDTLKRDAEIKLLLGCSEEDVCIISDFHDDGIMVYLFIKNPLETNP